MKKLKEEYQPGGSKRQEILRLVKLDQEASKKRWEYKPEEKDSE